MTQSVFSEDDHFLILDGYGYVFRAYYALPPLKRNSDGMPVGAVAGFCNMLFKIMADTFEGRSVFPAPLPSLWAVAVDAEGDTFRSELYPEYKQNRKQTPEELKIQLPLIRKAIDALGAATLEQDGYEADDLIASLARKAQQYNMPLTMISSDKDLMQLVGNKVSMYDPVKNTVIEQQQVLQKFGVGPEKVVDVQGLAGDSTDNIPGVPGIGLKTAALLINQFGTIEKVFEALDTMKQSKRKQLLHQYQQQAILSKKLATLKNDLEVEITDIEEFRIKKPDMKKMADFMNQMEFTTLPKRAAKIFGEEFLQHWRNVEKIKTKDYSKITKTSPQQEYNTPQKRFIEVKENITKTAFDFNNYKTIDSIKGLEEFLHKAAYCQIMALDIETTSLDAMQAKLVGISLACEIGEAVYLPLGHQAAETQGENQLFEYQQKNEDKKLEKQADIEEVLKIITEFIKKTAITIVGHNIKYDLLVLKNYGVTIDNPHDTMLLSYVLDAGRHPHNMDELARIHLNHEAISYSEIAGSGKNKINFANTAISEATRYAAEDADITLRLYQLLHARVAAEGKMEIYETLERPIINVLVDMEAAGVEISLQILDELSNRFQKKINEIAQKIYTLAGENFNIASSQQLGKIIYQKMGIRQIKKTRTGHAATGAKILERLCVEDNQIACEILQWRHYSKLLSTYTRSLPTYVNPTTSRVHTYYSLAATTTGRLSSANPNLQNIPIRTEEGRLIRSAFIAKKNHVFVCADYNQIELRLLAHIAEVDTLRKAFAKGIDIHAMTANEMFGTPIAEMDPTTRRRAKAINFGIIYGISAFGLAVQLGISRQEAEKYLNMYMKRFDGITRYMEHIKKFIAEHGYVETVFGRRCSFADSDKKTAVQKAHYTRAAINAPIQGSASDIVRRAMVRMRNEISKKKLQANMLLQVHDELIFEVKKGQEEQVAKIAKKVMEQAAKPKLQLSVPLVVNVSIGQNWDQAH